MARIGKLQEKHHVIRLLADRTDGEIILVAGGKRRAYLWTGAGTYSGEIALRSLAYSILREIGFHTKRRKARRASTATNR